MDCIERFVTEGQVFVPVNEVGRGEVVQLFWKDGETETLDMRCRSFLKKLLSFFGTSLSANRKRYGSLIRKKQLVPVPLSHGFTIVPFNVRETVGKQTSVGWILARAIVEFEKKSSHQTSIQLPHVQIPVLHSENFCFEQLKNARWVEQCYCEIHNHHQRKQWEFFKRLTGVLQR